MPKAPAGGGTVAFNYVKSKRDEWPRPEFQEKRLRHYVAYTAPVMGRLI